MKPPTFEPSPSRLQPEVERLESLIAQALRVAGPAFRLEPLRKGPLAPNHLSALWWLRLEGRLSVHELAQRVGTTLPQGTRLVDRLEQLDLAVRERSEEDRRIVRVKLSARGRELADPIRASVQANLGSVLASLDPEDRDCLLRVSERVVAALARR